MGRVIHLPGDGWRWGRDGWLVAGWLALLLGCTGEATSGGGGGGDLGPGGDGGGHHEEGEGEGGPDGGGASEPDGGGGGLAPGCSPEVCNGLDDDCSGVADDGLVCLCGWDDACYDGPPATRGVGVCRDGRRTCDVTLEFWGPCQGSVRPAEEVCEDFLDNDCDGVVDNGCAWCGLEEQCGDGRDDDCDGQTDEGCGPPCAERELCDNARDDDCDGQTDEGCAVCHPEERCGNGEDDDCDGAIDEGCLVCGDVEVCNNLVDDDCDGQTDEECVEQCGPGLQRACFPGNPAQMRVGLCRPGTQRCVDATLQWGECEGVVVPQPEVCANGLDEDCDGRIDNGCLVCQPTEVCGNQQDDDCDGQLDEECGHQCQPGGTEPCFPGPGVPGQGPCREGQRTCTERAFWGPCEGAVTSGLEVCGNGLDEDCDGQDQPCGPVRVPILLFGDCQTVACPRDQPHPVGCTVFFTPGDDRGCVANVPNDPVVYFQAGDDCEQGFVTGALLCADQPGPGLNRLNCPVNKPQVFYPPTPAGCPAVD